MVDDWYWVGARLVGEQSSQEHVGDADQLLAVVGAGERVAGVELLQKEV